MTYEELVAILESFDLPVAYDHFAEGNAPNPPFICYLNPRDNAFYADDKVYYQSQSIDMEVYTDRKDVDLETRIERILNENNLCFTKDENWINTEKLYQVVYSVDVDLDEYIEREE